MTDEHPVASDATADTRDAGYAERLRTLEGVWWKRALDVQRPYRRNLERLSLGATLDVGAGLGRNLSHLPAGSVGVDHNVESVRIARSRGLAMVTSVEFDQSPPAPASFDSILLAHVLEHMPEADADKILTTYLPFVRSGGTVVLICPQERGYASDPTHVRFVDRTGLRRHAVRHGIRETENRSFPFPRFMGRLFTYNEFVFVGRLPG
jgi:2-polyprenyl-3-methyl-5-hydroxy-6-metoxy-1,4-benzoquinol methylase